MSAPAAFPDDAIPPAEERGTLVVKEQAVARVATTAALTVPGVIRQVGGLPRLTGKELPRADVSVGDHSVSVNLYVAVAWPCVILTVAESIHDAVGRALTDTIGLPLHRLNVVIAHVVSAPVVVAPEKPGTAEQAVTFSAVHPVVEPRPPTASPAAVPLAIVLALALLALTVVAGREFLIVHEGVTGLPWIGTALERIAEVQWSWWLFVACAAAAAAGLALVVLGLKPRTKTHSGATATASSVPIVWLRPTDVARVCSDHAGVIAGVESVRTTVTRKRVEIDVRRLVDGNVGDEALAEDVRTAVAPTLAVLAHTRDVVVRVRWSRS
ncbi:MAG: Asp23/Gls24 family envelope stress response protein [Rhodococcus sp. (in: high G+C Gram-positive bacteria)]